MYSANTVASVRRTQSTNLRQAMLRVVGGTAIAIAIFTSAGSALAAPPQAGLFECGPGECQPAEMIRSTMILASPDVGDPRGPHLIP